MQRLIKVRLTIFKRRRPIWQINQDIEVKKIKATTFIFKKYKERI